MENELKVAIQGVRGAFHEVAAREFFQDRPLAIVEKMTFGDLLDSVVDGSSDYGIIAIENTIAGTIHANLKLLRQKRVRICGEVSIRIRQDLVVLPGTKIEDLREVRSHYMAINQSRDFFQQYPQIRLVECDDTALAIQQVRQENNPTIGAIGGEMAARLYGLEVLVPGIETNKKNYTRFLIVKREDLPGLDAYNKASLSIVLPSHMGSLSQILSIIAFYGIDLTKIESLPIIGEPLNYMFYIDIRFESMERYHNMLTAIRPLLKELDVLGEYMADECSWKRIHDQ